MKKVVKKTGKKRAAKKKPRLPMYTVAVDKIFFEKDVVQHVMDQLKIVTEFKVPFTIVEFELINKDGK